MILCLDIGNSHIFGGIFEGDKLRQTFRKASKTGASSDELGVFFRAVLKENGIEPASITHISMCSVVPELIYTISASCQKYFDMRPFILQAGVSTGLKIRYRNPLEVGSDRIANAIAGINLFPNENLLIVDLGTATTMCAIGEKQEYLGGVIIPGLRMSMEALDRGTSKLGSVEIVHPAESLGRTTMTSIQSGLYYGHLGALNEISSRVINDVFHGEKPRIVATGGFAALFESANIFDEIVPDLVLQGLLAALLMNLDNKPT